MNQKAPEAFRTISEVASDLDLPQHVLRFWETRFSQIKPMKRGGGRRYYRPEDVDLLRGIRHLLYGEGYTIKGVKRILKERGARHVMDVWKSDQKQGRRTRPAPQPSGKSPEPVPVQAASAMPPVARPVAASAVTAVPLPSHGVPAAPLPATSSGQSVPVTYEAAEAELPRFGALRQVSTGVSPVPRPMPGQPQTESRTEASQMPSAPSVSSTLPVSRAALSEMPIPGPSMPAGPLPAHPHPAPTPAAPPPSSPSPAMPVAPGSGLAPAMAPVPAGSLDTHGREKLQSALYELTECRRILFDALKRCQ